MYEDQNQICTNCVACLPDFVVRQYDPVRSSGGVQRYAEDEPERGCRLIEGRLHGQPRRV